MITYKNLYLSCCVIIMHILVTLIDASLNFSIHFIVAW